MLKANKKKVQESFSLLNLTETQKKYLGWAQNVIVALTLLASAAVTVLAIWAIIESGEPAMFLFAPVMWLVALCFIQVANLCAMIVYIAVATIISKTNDKK